MNEAEFLEAARTAEGDAAAIDGLCLKWLKLVAKDYGKDGQVAIDLLLVVEKLLT